MTTQQRNFTCPQTLDRCDDLRCKHGFCLAAIAARRVRGQREILRRVAQSRREIDEVLEMLKKFDLPHATGRTNR